MPPRLCIRDIVYRVDDIHVPSQYRGWLQYPAFEAAVKGMDSTKQPYTKARIQPPRKPNELPGL